MPSVEEYLEDPLYANWVKSSLALNITNEVIRPFAVKEIKRLHQTIISSLADKGPCTSCTVDTAAGCRRGICSHIKRKIENHHLFPNPSFVNTNIESWCTDSWEIAKCYMPKGEGYRNSSAADADLSASINVIMNCLHFQSFVTCDPRNPHDRFCKARQFRNTVMHSKSMKVSDDEMKENLDILIDILEEIARTCFKDDLDDAVTNIKKIKNNTVTITMEGILKVREQAMVAMELTPACIEEGLEALRKEIQEGKHAIRRETETVQGKSLIPNFVEGCQVSLRRMTFEHIMNQRPDHIKPDDWTVANFLSNLNLHGEKNDLSARHRDMLIPTSGTPVDINDWDIFLYIFILKKIDNLPVPVEDSVKSYVREVKDLRNMFFRNPESIEKSQLMGLCEHLSDGDFKREMTQIFNKTITLIDVVHSNNILTAWCMDDETYSNTQEETSNGKGRVRRKDYNGSKKLLKRVDEMQCRINTLEQKFSRMEELQSKKKTKHHVNIRTRIKVNPKGRNKQLEKDVEENFIAKNTKKNIAKANGGLDYFQKEFSLKDVNAETGSIILEVTCSSIKHLVDFWDSCMDGRAAKALSYVRDSYRDYFECDTLDFEVILTKKEVKRCINQIVDDLPLELYDEVLLKEVQGMMETEQEETHEDETRDDETHKEESHDEETHEEEILEECDEEETDEEDIHGEETDATETHDEETNDEEILEEETYEEETHEKTDEEETDEEETLEQDTHEEEPNEEDTTLLVRFSAIQDERGFETLREGSQEEETKEDTKEEDTFVVRSDAGIKAIQEGPSAHGPKTKVEGGFGEKEADRLVNFLRQILEDLEGGDVATMKTYLDDIIRHSKENDEKMFYECVRKFLLGVSFKSGTSPNLIRQVTRGFNMIQRQPEFGDLVATKLKVIEKEQLEQSAIKPSTSGTPIFKQAAGKSAVLIEEDIEVGEMDVSRSRPIKPRTEMPGKYHEKEVFKKATTSMMENPSDTYEMFKTKPRDVAETTSKYQTPKTSYESDLVKLKFDESGKSGREKSRKVDDAMTDKSVH